jgi:hypothetical protein
LLVAGCWHGLAKTSEKSVDKTLGGKLYEDLHKRYDTLGKMINNFRKSVISGYLPPDDSTQQQDSEAPNDSEDDE